MDEFMETEGGGDSGIQLSEKPRNPLLTFILIFVLLIIISGGILWFYLSQDESEVIHRSVEEDVEFIEENDEGGIKGDVKIEADIEIVTEGGYESFKEKFSKCEPAELTSKLMDTLIYYYEVIGKEGGLCKVKSKFLANPNPEWVNKEMICLYDNSKDFESAIQDMSNCEGELYNLMIGA